MAHVTHKLSGALQGALAGGGDPATSPLYVFGPFLRLIVTAGVASVTFGVAIWLAVLTVITVSAMYRLVMIWVTDGSGGSGLNEEEFGPWAVKINAGITVVEYTLTFLVSIAALVTFIADRFPELNLTVAGISLRTYVAIALTILTGVAVNRGPRMSARVFGPATAAVLLLLWTMIVATIWKLGFRLPGVDLEAFSASNIQITLGGYARILALMTGIEIFANLVAAYDGPARERSRKAFGSLVIVMGTTALTMLIVGPAIYDLSNPLDPHVSVFTQTMDKLLPGPLAYAGTLIGTAVLLSAAAASAQGIQNLALGLRYRHYIPAYLGQRNRFDVADKPVWLQVGVCVACFLFFGTNEETYLSLYAAGVFILLSLTGWAGVKRLVRQLRARSSLRTLLALSGTLIAALLTTGATVIIFEERFTDGAWTYLIFIPLLYWAFDHFRRKLGPPTRVEDRLGLLISSSSLPPLTSESLYAGVSFKRILVPLDKSPAAEQSLLIAKSLARTFDGEITLLSVIEPEGAAPRAGGDEEPSAALTDEGDAREYLDDVQSGLLTSGYRAEVVIKRGSPAALIGDTARAQADLLIMGTHGRSRFRRWLVSSITSDVIYQTTPPLLLVRPTEDWRSTRTRFSRLLVTLDGSAIAEQVLPFVHGLAERHKSDVLLLSVREGPESDGFSQQLAKYLEHVKASLSAKGVIARTRAAEGGPAQTISRVAVEEKSDLIMMVSHGRGGVDRQEHVKLGSVVDLVLQVAPCPVFLVSALPPTQEAPRPS